MKKILAILMFAAVFGMVICSVAAVDMIEHDFDGKCKVKIPETDQWMGDQVPFGDGIHGGGISIHFFTNDDLNGESLEDYIASQHFEDKKTDGDLTIYKSESKYVVLTHTDDEYLLIKDSDLEEAKTIALSADFLEDESNATNEPSNPVNDAVELESHDFGSFKMDVPKGASFKETTDLEELYDNGKIYTDSVNDLNITYADDSQIDDKFMKEFMEDLEEDGAKVSTKGDFNLIESGPYHELFFNNGTQFILIVSSQLDSDTLIDMANSVEFAK